MRAQQLKCTIHRRQPPGPQTSELSLLYLLVLSNVNKVTGRELALDLLLCILGGVIHTDF